MQAFPKRKLVIGSTVVAVAAFAGGAVAATQGSSNPRQQYLNDVAKRLNVTPAQLNSALNGAALDQLNAAVKAGKLTQAQADALKQRIQQGAPGGVPFIGPPGPGGPGPAPATARSDSASAARCSSDPTRRRSPSRSTSA